VGALTWREVLKASRPLSWFNTVFAVAAGAFVAGESLRSRRNLLALVYFTLPYNLTLYGINDVCDYPSDRLNPRKNSVEGGLLPPETHRPMLGLIAALNAPLLPPLLAAGDARANGLLAFLLATTVAYSAPPLRLKEVPGVDSLTSATHFVTPFVFGLALNRATDYPRREIATFVSWCIASQSFGAIQDVAFDRAVGSRSIATALGPHRTALAATALYLAATIAVLTGQRGTRAKRIAAALTLLPYATNTALFLRDPRPERANQHWRVFLGLNLAAGAALTNILLWRHAGRKQDGTAEIAERAENEGRIDLYRTFSVPLCALCVLCG
jgi:4-hydroxybenzoate polyprenyltransferase